MEKYLIINLYFFIILIFGEIIKKKYKLLDKYTSLDLYLYGVLYLTVLIIIFSSLNLLDKFHLIVTFILFFYLSFNFKKILQIDSFNFVKTILILNCILLLCINKEFLWWDEFSSWGLKTKELLIHNSIYYENIITNQNKPFGSNLLHYIFLKYHTYDEGIIIFSQFTLTILLLKNIFNDFKIDNYLLLNFFIYFLLIYFLAFIFNYGLFSIYTGVITSLLFIKIISILFIKKIDNSKLKLFELFPIVFLIIFFKDFSLFYIVYIFLILLISFFNKEKKYLNIKNTYIFSFSTFVTIIFQKFISFKLKHTTTISSFNINELFEKLITTRINWEQINSINIFQGSIFRIPNQIIEKIFSKTEFFYEFKTNLIFWLIFLSLMNLFLFFSNKKKYKEKIILFLSMYLISYLHIFLILTSYTIFFGPNEASAMASFGRYIGLYFMPYTIFLIYNGFTNDFNLSKFKFILLSIFLLIAPAKSIEILIPERFNNFDSKMQHIKYDKKQIKKLSNFIQKNYKSKKIYVLIDSDDGFVLNMFKIYLYPDFINKECWSFRKNKKPTPYMFNCDYKNDEQIIKRLNSYEIVINYNQNKTYDDILINNDYNKIESIFNSNIYNK
jgi:hypothetical protein